MTDQQQREVQILERLEAGAVDMASAAKAHRIAVRHVRQPARTPAPPKE